MSVQSAFINAAQTTADFFMDIGLVLTEVANAYALAQEESNQEPNAPVSPVHPILLPGEKRLDLPIPVINEDKMEHPLPLAEHLTCSICQEKEKQICFDCGHLTCEACAAKLICCPFCRQKIAIKVKMFMC